NPSHRLIGFATKTIKDEPYNNNSAIVIAGGRNSPALLTGETVAHLVTPIWVWKAEYDATLSKNVLLETRAGGMILHFDKGGYSTAPRVEDVGNNSVSGEYYSFTQLYQRPQASGSVSYYRSGWIGTHNFKFGGELMYDINKNTDAGFRDPRNA